MYYPLSILIVFGVTALGVPLSDGIAARLATRAAHSRLSHLNMPVYSEPEMSGGPSRTNSNYSLNWSGAVLNAPPSGTKFTSVSAEFSVPTPRPANNKAGSASAWVGIDGNTYRNAILQTGIDFSVTLDGSVSFDAWYEWYPDHAYNFPDIRIMAGDRVCLSVISKTSESGTVAIENLTTGQKSSQNITAPDSSSMLGGQNAEWIVEDYEEGGKLVTLDNFGVLAFNNVSAGLSDSSSVRADGADVMNIQQNGQILTSVIVTMLNVIIVSQTESGKFLTVPGKDGINLE